MTITSRDIPTAEGQTVADRLKVARKEAGITRKALADDTGVPYSTLEKYESGNMDPNTTRLQVICEHLDVSVAWVLNGDKKEEDAAPSKPAESISSANVAESPSEDNEEDKPQHTETINSANDNNPESHIRDLLSRLDEMRLIGFDGSQRQAMALVQSTHLAMKYLGPVDLLRLAYERRLHQREDCLDGPNLLDLFKEDLNKGQTYCGNIEERILDTAILGVDLFSIERDSLIKLADKLEEEHDVEAPKWAGFSWGDHGDFVPLIRPILQAMCISGAAPDFTNNDVYRARE